MCVCVLMFEQKAACSDYSNKGRQTLCPGCLNSDYLFHNKKSHGKSWGFTQTCLFFYPHGDFDFQSFLKPNPDP